MIEVYGCSSPNVRKVVIMLEELGLDYSLTYVDVMRGGGQVPEFAALNPLGRVPVLVDQAGDAAGEPIFESGAILIYLAEAYGDQQLLARRGPERYAALKWLMLQMANFGPVLGNHNHFIITGSDENAYAARRFRSQAHKLYRLLNDRLAQSPWLAGQAYSIADIATYPWAVYVENHGFDWAELPHLSAWCERIAARPAVERAKTEMEAMILGDASGTTQVTQQDLGKLFWIDGDEVPKVDFERLYPKGMASRANTEGS